MHKKQTVKSSSFLLSDVNCVLTYSDLCLPQFACEYNEMHVDAVRVADEYEKKTIARSRFDQILYTSSSSIHFIPYLTFIFIFFMNRK